MGSSLTPWLLRPSQAHNHYSEVSPYVELTPAHSRVTHSPPNPEAVRPEVTQGFTPGPWGLTNTLHRGCTSLQGQPGGGSGFMQPALQVYSPFTPASTWGCPIALGLRILSATVTALLRGYSGGFLACFPGVTPRLLWSLL